MNKRPELFVVVGDDEDDEPQVYTVEHSTIFEGREAAEMYRKHLDGEIEGANFRIMQLVNAVPKVMTADEEAEVFEAQADDDPIEADIAYADVALGEIRDIMDRLRREELGVTEALQQVINVAGGR